MRWINFAPSTDTENTNLLRASWLQIPGSKHFGFQDSYPSTSTPRVASALDEFSNGRFSDPVDLNPQTRERYPVSPRKLTAKDPSKRMVGGRCYCTSEMVVF